MSPSSANTYVGGCHCGGIEFRYCCEKPPREWSLRACQCSFCRAHHALSTSDPLATLEFTERRPGALQRYRFGQGTADFLLCRECGVYIGAEMQVAEGCYGIINVNALRPIPEDLRSPEPMNYDAESAGPRTARRTQRWSPIKKG